MAISDQTDYELLDFGDGRKLERFAQVVLDRPAPAVAHLPRRRPKLWSSAHAVFHRRGSQPGRWRQAADVPDTWLFRYKNGVFHLHLTPFGQVGIFPEQKENWDWMARHLARTDRPLRILNLFAYTGAMTLIAAANGAEVTHVDAAKTTVDWARQNARASGLAEAPIRWIVEDARKYVRRELKRKRQYDGVVLDPPTYGHGPQGRAWHLARDLMPLLEDCARLTAADRRMYLLTCHTPGFGPPELEACLSDVLFGRCGAGVVADELSLYTGDGRRLPSGAVARWPG